MKNLKARQEFLLSNWGFKCCCDICQDEETTTDNENYEHFERLKLQTEKLRKVSNTPGSFRLTLIKKEVIVQYLKPSRSYHFKVPRHSATGWSICGTKE